MKSTYRMSLEVVSDVCKSLLCYSVPKAIVLSSLQYIHIRTPLCCLLPLPPSPPLPTPTGEFGDVLVGNWYKPKSAKPIKVAVKTLKVSAPLIILGCAPACACVPSLCPSLHRMAPQRRLAMTSSLKLLSWDSLTITMSFTCMG